MKFYAILIHNEKVRHMIPHEDWMDAFVCVLQSYNEIFGSELIPYSTPYKMLKEHNYLHASKDEDNSYAFQIMEVK